ncbi:uncharacterized protein LOC124889600 [Capsicum annuum]|uniref:uncharacterized protein LOC124889600 n=1 Tax=Capsicum annuum TaxID=4072 RepID=UPI001FB08A06|nr:uncharacterized protein LOC124889600 [Capsicum annuum]
MYPLCITTSDKSNKDLEFDSETGAIMRIEGTGLDTATLAVVESNNQYYLYVPEIKTTKFITDCQNTEVKKKQLYKDKKTLKAVMEKYALDQSFNIRALRSDKKSWYMKASSLLDYDLFQVWKFNDENTCSMSDRVLKQLQATINFVSNFTKSKLVNYKRKHTPADIIEEMKVVYRFDINYMKAWRAKERAIEILRGGAADGYRQMPRYIYILNFVYPGSHIRMHKAVDNKFKYLFIALQPMIHSFKHCGPVFVVDGAHLSGLYQETFLCASTLDGAGCILPIAYGVVDSKNDSAWT